MYPQTVYTHNAADQPTSMTYPNNETVGFGYSARRLIASVGIRTYDDNAITAQLRLLRYPHLA